MNRVEWLLRKLKNSANNTLPGSPSGKIPVFGGNGDSIIFNDNDMTEIMDKWRNEPATWM